MLPRSADVIVIGGGPAGLAAGMHLSRAGYRALLLEKGQLGGQAGRIDWIENYPGFPAGVRGRDLMALWSAQARRWGLRLLQAEAKCVARKNGSFRVLPDKGRALSCRAVVCCVGAEFKRLGVPGEDELWGCGVHHAAFEEAPRLRNKVVAVAGGGEAAVHQALLLSRFARRVHLLTRGSAIKAHRLLQQRMRNRPNLIHTPNVMVRSVEGPGRVKRISIQDTVSGRCSRLDVSGLFVLIGKRKPIFFDGKERTPGYFVAGDASSGICRQVVVAAGKGVEAAMKCIQYIEGWDQSRGNP